jgi:hypothetical protein
MVEVKKLIEQFEKSYNEQKSKECEELHNAIADILAEKKASIQNALFVLEMVRFELLRAKYEQIMGHAVVPPGGGVERKAKLTTGEAQ